MKAFAFATGRAHVYSARQYRQGIWMGILAGVQKVGVILP